MRYVGIARAENGHLIMPDGFQPVAGGTEYDVLEVGDALILTNTKADTGRRGMVDRLVDEVIEQHREAIEGLGK